jgi:predicted alpha/beta-fold hydrolase
MIPFEPLFRHSHLQTIASHFWPRRTTTIPVERRLVPTEPGIQVLVESQRPVGAVAGDIVMVHGLEGSGEAGYMASLAAAALSAGFAAHRFHMRTCGGTEMHADTLYHAGLTSDLLAVLRAFCQQGRGSSFLVGFSLGGNVVLKLAGELGESAADLIRGVCAVSTPLDLAICARRIDELENCLYQYRFVRKMHTRLSATGRYQPREYADLRTVTAIDDRITAPSFGFGDAANYYRTQSAIHFLGAIRVPTLLIQAKDDPLVPYTIFEGLPSNACIEVLATEHGGHLGFLGKRPHRFWLDEAVLAWIQGRARGASL